MRHPTAAPHPRSARTHAPHPSHAPRAAPRLPRAQHSNSRRTLWYTVLEVAVLAAVGVFNVMTVSKMFRFAGGGPLNPFGGRIVV